MEATYHLLEPRPYPGTLSLVIPMYNEESVVEALHAEIDRFLTEVKCETEVLLINDGSSDRTLPMIAGWRRSMAASRLSNCRETSAIRRR